jgi:hypothetical protein
MTSFTMSTFLPLLPTRPNDFELMRPRVLSAKNSAVFGAGLMNMALWRMLEPLANLVLAPSLDAIRVSSSFRLVSHSLTSLSRVHGRSF